MGDVVLVSAVEHQQWCNVHPGEPGEYQCAGDWPTPGIPGIDIIILDGPDGPEVTITAEAVTIDPDRLLDIARHCTDMHARIRPAGALEGRQGAEIR